MVYTLLLLEFQSSYGLAWAVYKATMKLGFSSRLMVYYSALLNKLISNFEMAVRLILIRCWLLLIGESI